MRFNFLQLRKNKGQIRTLSPLGDVKPYQLSSTKRCLSDIERHISVPMSCFTGAMAMGIALQQVGFPGSGIIGGVKFAPCSTFKLGKQCLHCTSVPLERENVIMGMPPQEVLAESIKAIDTNSQQVPCLPSQESPFLAWGWLQTMRFQSSVPVSEKWKSICNVVENSLVICCNPFVR